MAHLVRTLYSRAKNLPVVGGAMRGARNLFRHPFLERRRLLSRDVIKALKVARDIFDKGSEEYIRNFRRAPLFKKKFSYGNSGDFDVLMLYTAVRVLQPEVVVETGVASGRSSSAILQGLSENGKGTLYSIDVPKEYDTEHPETYVTKEGNRELKGFVPKGKQPGWLIPDELRSRWKLILGDSNEELPKLLSKLDRVDMFYHDGDHSFETMSFEFKNAWQKIPKGGIVFSDDIDWNAAWKEFITRERPPRYDTYRHFGIAIK